jgi:multidrug efflux system outer membrane protein
VAQAEAARDAALWNYRLAIRHYNGDYEPYTREHRTYPALFPAQLTLAAVRTSMLASSANVYKAMGGGWVDIADAMSGTAVPLPSGALQENAATVSK